MNDKEKVKSIMRTFGTPLGDSTLNGLIKDGLKKEGEFRQRMKTRLSEMVEKDTDGEFTLKFDKPDPGWSWSHKFGPYILPELNTISIFGDAHLAPRQYGLARRRADFFITLQDVMLRRQGPSDVCIFLGDFFDSRKVEADVFTTAVEMLKLYSGVHYIFVEGNHDRAVLKGELTWVEAIGAAINERIRQSPAGMVYDESSVTTKKQFVPVIFSEEPVTAASKNCLIVVCLLDYAGKHQEETRRDVR